MKLNKIEQSISLQINYHLKSGLTIGIGDLQDNSSHRKIRKAYLEAQEWAGVPV